MEVFKFISKEKALSQDRSEFANMVCKLIYNKNDKDLKKAVKDVEKAFLMFEEYVRNIYELIDDSIPMFAYYRLKKYGAENWDFSEKEYNQALETCKRACIEYYS